MKKVIYWMAISFIPGLALQALAQQPPAGKAPAKKAQPTPAPKAPNIKIIGFVDANKDGVNDRFVDANGDGKNDLTGKPYPHRFKFVDKNKDGINDLWIDQDGDGVNDLISILKKKGRNRRDDHVIDVDRDGRNDVTGDRYDLKKQRWHGNRWGFWNEQKGIAQGRLVDENANGLDDRFEAFRSRWMQGPRGKQMRQDMFIDEDGDGICDGRGDVIRMMGRKSRGHHGDRKSGGGHHW